MLQPGATILIPSGPRNDLHRKHLHVVVARRSGPPVQILMVSVSSIGDQKHDDTTILVADQHPFLRHRSYIKHQVARVEFETDIEPGIQTGAFAMREELDEEVLQRIRDGFSSSKFAKPFAKKFLNDCEPPC